MRIWIALCLLSFHALAGEPNERRVCPNLTDDARNLVDSIHTLRDQLRQLPECQPVQEKVNVLSSVINKPKWKEIKDLFNSNGTPELEGKDIDTMVSLVNDASVAVADTVALLSGTASHCVQKEKKASFLSTLSGVTREISTLAGGLTGPYGQAVSIVGGVLTGTISGIDKLFKKGKVYDFNNTDEELLFLNQFCSYAELQQEIIDFEKLADRPAELDKLVNEYSGVKIRDLVANCTECDAYKRAWEANEQAVRIIGRISEDARIVTAASNESIRPTFSRCMEINRAFKHEASDYNQYIRLLEKYENPLQSDSDKNMITDAVTALKGMQTDYPSLSECLRNPREISLKFNDFIRDEIIGFNNTLFQQQMSYFRMIANRRYKNPLGDSIYKALEGVKWAKREKERVQKKLLEPNYNFSKETMIKEKNVLHTRMSEQLMPPYLKFRFKRSQKNVDKFIDDFAEFKTREIKHFNPKLGTHASNLTELLEALKLNKAQARVFTSSYVKVFNEAQLVTLAVENNHRYCSYLEFSRTLSTKNREICIKELGKMKTDLIVFTAHDSEIDALSDFEEWALRNELDIQTSYVMDYAERIRIWIERGQERWERSGIEN